jgi:hypothetical protein
VKIQELIDRARSVAMGGCHYGLGCGGFDPTRTHPWDDSMSCDCSGYVAWALGVARHTSNPWYVQQNGGWIETSAIIRDCETPFGFFAQVMPKDARPGDLLVYGDRSAGGKMRQGHVGICTEIDKGPAKVIHCSKGNDRKLGDAIVETDVGWWTLAGGIVARCAWVEP